MVPRDCHLKTVLNVGGGGRDLPALYKDYEQKLLDIDPNVQPDICADAKDMCKLKAGQFDAVYCSHTLEHFYRHDVSRVLAGFRHVLKPYGFAHIAVPDVLMLMEIMVKGGQDIEETWYVSPGGPISFHDVLYGWNKAMANGNLFYAHKCGFSEKSLGDALKRARFPHVMTAVGDGNIVAFAFKSNPSPERLRNLGI